MAATEREVNDFLARIPYARFLGITAQLREDGLVTVLNFEPMLIGNPLLPALHGGTIGAFLEMTAIAQLVLDIGIASPPKPIGITIDYLRSGKTIDTFARAHITKQGRRVVTVSAEAWQTDPQKPIAAAHGHFLLQQETEPESA